MIVDWNRDFDQQLDRLEADQSARGKRVFELVLAELDSLAKLQAQPVDETPRFKRVRQSGRYQVWRVSHPFEAGIALRLICWFPPQNGRVVVALFTGDKAAMGDVFYDSVSGRADQIIDRWIAETDGEK
jgi:hypothetical protein